MLSGHLQSVLRCCWVTIIPEVWFYIPADGGQGTRLSYCFEYMLLLRSLPLHDCGKLKDGIIA